MRREADRSDAQRGGCEHTGTVIDLLRYAATVADTSFNEMPQDSVPARDQVVNGLGLEGRRLDYLTQAGLAPLLYRAIADVIDEVPAEQRDALLSADLTAQVRHGNAIEVACELIDVCRDLGVDVTLLKGISISEQYYPAGHLRPMGDIDILVAGRDREQVEGALLGRGYLRLQADGPIEESSHGAPLWHPEKGVWVEVHTALFPTCSKFREGKLFGPERIAALSVPSSFHGRPVQRLSDELQLVYIASYWIRDLSRNAVHPSFLPPLLDAVLLANTSGARMDWQRMLGWLDNEMATASLWLTLAYLARHKLAPLPPNVLARLASRQNLVGASERALIHALLDISLLAGKPLAIGWRAPIVWNTLLAHGSSAGKLLSLPWKLAFPSSVPERYTPRYMFHLLRRAARLIRSRP